MKRADVLARVGGVVLLGALFLPWVRLAGVIDSAPDAPLTFSLWDTASVIRWLLVVLAVVIVAAPPRVRVVAAWIAVVLVATRLLDRPGEHFTTLSYGGFVALAGALAAAWPGELRRGEVVAGVGGLALALSLGLDWYSFSLVDAFEATGQDPTLEREDTFSAWVQFAVIDIALAALGALALAVPLTRQRAVAKVSAAVGWVAIVLVAARILWPAHAGLEPAAGAWIALLAAAVAWAGSSLATRREPDAA